MPVLKPPTIPAPDTAPDDPRIGRLLGSGLAGQAQPQAVLIGFPSDEGVRRNGGRIGAASAPGAFRQAFYKLTPDAARAPAFHDLIARTLDVGDLEVSGDVERDQESLGDALAAHLARSVVPIIIGGGHETAFGHFLGYVKADRNVAILNWDAHADVRDLKDGKGHSGSPFRQALTHPSRKCRHYTVAGLLPYSVAEAHLQFIAEHQGHTVWKDALSRDVIGELYGALSGPVMATFDLDAVDQAHAPGVSAPAVDGLRPDLWLYTAYMAGKCRAVTSMDLVELNPRFDRDAQTARLAALTVWYFMKGLAER